MTSRRNKQKKNSKKAEALVIQMSRNNEFNSIIISDHDYLVNMWSLFFFFFLSPVVVVSCLFILLLLSRISMSDIAQKLLLDSAEDAEYIVAKVSPSCRIILQL